MAGFVDGNIAFQAHSLDRPAQTYYKVFGSLKSDQTPVVVLHGGPGAGHDYMLPFAKLSPDIPVIFYDQIGCAKSTHFRDKVGDQAFWHPDLFVAELANVIKHFDLDRVGGPGFDILGHSWGGILAAYFASQQPRGLGRLIIASASSDGELFARGFWEKTKQLSQDSQEAVNIALEKNDFTEPAYLAALAEFMNTFLCRAKPTPAFLGQHLAEDRTLRLTMQGESPWRYDGILKRWSSIPYLPKINVPTMLVTGELDTSPDWVYVPFFEHIPKVRWIVINGASHMYWLDTPELEDKTLKLVHEFLRPGKAH